MMCMLYVILCNPETSLALTIDHVEIKYILLNIYKELFCPQVDSIGWTVMTVVCLSHFCMAQMAFPFRSPNNKICNKDQPFVVHVG